MKKAQFLLSGFHCDRLLIRFCKRVRSEEADCQHDRLHTGTYESKQMFAFLPKGWGVGK